MWYTLVIFQLQRTPLIHDAVRGHLYKQLSSYEAAHDDLLEFRRLCKHNVPVTRVEDEHASSSMRRSHCQRLRRAQPGLSMWLAVVPDEAHVHDMGTFVLVTRCKRATHVETCTGMCLKREMRECQSSRVL